MRLLNLHLDRTAIIRLGTKPESDVLVMPFTYHIHMLYAKARYRSYHNECASVLASLHGSTTPDHANKPPTSSRYPATSSLRKAISSDRLLWFVHLLLSHLQIHALKSFINYLKFEHTNILLMIGHHFFRRRRFRCCR